MKDEMVLFKGLQYYIDNPHELDMNELVREVDFIHLEFLRNKQHKTEDADYEIIQPKQLTNKSEIK